MLTIARLRPDGAERSYYERTVASSREDYYAGRGEAHGEWWGTGAAGLGLAGEIADGELSVVLRGVDPASGVTLRTPPPTREIARPRIDPDTGQVRVEAVTLRPVAGFDLTFSAPKSVSLLYALGNTHVQGEVAGAHREAWQDAMRLLEAEACVVRRGRNGVVRERAGFVAAGYQHRTSRDGDPHLHTHVVIANMAPSEDARWRALDAELFIRDWRHAAGYVYQARLRHELTARLGVEWGPVTNGAADLARVPVAVVDEFSTRRDTILDHAAAAGSISYRSQRVAHMATRPDKQSVDWPVEVERWRARAAEHGLGAREYARLTPGGRAPHTPDARETRADLLGPAGLTATGQTFTQADVVCAWAGAHPEGCTVQELRDHARTTLEDSRVVRVGDARLGAPARATTREVLAREQEALAVALRGRGRAGARVGDTRVAREVHASPVVLTDEQARVARTVAESPDRVACVVGRAGAGKTTAIAAGARALETEGIAVLGAAPSAQAAHALAAAAGIDARTLHAILRDPHASLPAGAVLVVDEASMADTRTLAAILVHAEERDARVVLVGDPAQLPAVGPGGLFAALCEREGVTRLDGNRRQHAAWERDALTDLREGQVEAALAAYASHGRVAACEDPADAHARLVADWWDAAQQVGTGEAIMLAHRRTDVRALNHAARSYLQAAGHLDGPAIDVGGREYQVGDRVIARTNDRRLGIHNGTRATITHIAAATGDIRVRDDHGSEVTLPPAYAARSLDHAYALTVHAAQGATVTHAFVLASDQARLAEWGYVALSRAQATTRIYVLDTTDARPLGAIEPARPGPTLDDLVDRLRGRAAEPLATDQIGPSPVARAQTARHGPRDQTRDLGHDM